MENKLNACENRWLRQILRIKYTDRVSNTEVRVRTGQEIAENCHCIALPQGETELDSRSWLETEKGERTSLQHPWPDGPLG